MKAYMQREKLYKIQMLLTNPFEPDPRVYKEAKSLVKAGFSVEVLAWDRTGLWPPAEVLDGIEITRFRCKGKYGGGLSSLRHFLGFYWHLAMNIRRHPPGALHCHDLDTAAVGWLLKKLFSIPIFIYDAHEPDYYAHFPKIFKYLIDRLEAFVARRASGVFITNGLQEKKFQRLHARKTLMIRNVPDPTTGGLEKPVHTNGLVIGRVGYIKPGIGLESLLEAAASLRKKFPAIKVVLVGKVFEAYQPIFETLLQKYAELVEYRGFFPYPEVLQNYRDFSISYLGYELTPEFRYISPTKLFESMAFGVPVIVSPVGDVREILQKYPCGLILQTVSTAEIATAIEDILAAPALQKQFSLTGRQAFEQDFNWTRMEKNLVEFYRSSSFSRLECGYSSGTTIGEK